MPASKKTTRKKKALRNNDEPANHALMIPVDEELFNTFTEFRKQRKENRDFPWTVRDCGQIMVAEYLEKHGN